ncbi:ABC transporter substrate-binding protein [Phaeovulum vinaykumarii]|uniref:ABC transporter substrate-binding protein n=1 Tax=Phaeovulum vinaykumarii TaxID=407234 RepID=UPI001AECEAC0|nr:ABC transporter substrate-binding protein [Phaeovulum vinaykumarii]
MSLDYVFEDIMTRQTFPGHSAAPERSHPLLRAGLRKALVPALVLAGLATSALAEMAPLPEPVPQPATVPQPVADAPVMAAPRDRAARPTADGIAHFAQVAAFEGGSGMAGQTFNLGIRAAFEEANRAGGVNGLTLALHGVNDSYEPDQTIAAGRQIADDPRMLAFVGSYGTATSTALQSVAADAGMALVGPLTGAGFARNTALGNVFNLRTSYAAEAEAWVAHLVDQRGFTRIGVLYQDDGFGRSGLAGVRAALARRGLETAAIGGYVRNTTAVKAAFLDMRDADVEAIAVISTQAPLSTAIRLARAHGLPDTVFTTLSFLSADALAAELGPMGAGVIFSQVVPPTWETDRPVVARYLEALAAVEPEAAPAFISLEGYMVGRLVLAGLAAAGPDPDRARFLKAMAGLTEVPVEDLTLHFGPDDNQGLDAVFLTRLSADGRIEDLTN